MLEFEDDDNPLDDSEYPDDPDDDELDAADECPYCGRSIYHDVVQCPNCGNYLSREDAPRHLPRWIVVGFVLGLLACLVLIVRLCR